MNLADRKTLASNRLREASDLLLKAQLKARRLELEVSYAKGQLDLLDEIPDFDGEQQAEKPPQIKTLGRNEAPAPPGVVLRKDDG